METVARDPVATWGWDRAQAYVLDLHGAFDLLAAFRSSGETSATSDPAIEDTSARAT